jgi:uncharacterized membrane protein YsdA (DUF1294 family)
MKYLMIGYLAIVVVMSMIAFAAYGIDKHQARDSGRRISERRLQQLALWGGWPGAWLGQIYFRHKTQKRGFQWQFRAIVALHVSLLAGVLYWWIS